MTTLASARFALQFLLSAFCVGLYSSPCRCDDATSTKNILDNGGLEGELNAATGLPEGRVVTQQPSDAYKVEVVDGGRTGKKCLRISGEGERIQIFVKHLPMSPEKRSVISGWIIRGRRRRVHFVDASLHRPRRSPHQLDYDRRDQIESDRVDSDGND